MTEVPMWWLVVSAIFFVFAVISHLAMIALLVKLMTVVKSVQPTIEKSVEKVEAVAERLENVAKSAQGTVDSLGGSTRHIAQSVEGVVAAGAQKLEKVAGIMAVGFAGLKLYREFQEVMEARKAAKEEEEMAA